MTEVSAIVRPLDTPAEMRAAVELYRDVHELAATDPAVSPRLLAALRHNGGSVIGAFVHGRLVGFVYGFLGRDPHTGELYHYSQMAAVDRAWQGRGIGRRLKLGQRDHVLATGVTRMRWAFDPVRAANAYFNLDVLGARGRWFVRNLYGVEETGRDRGVPSDRLVVEWDLLTAPQGRDTRRAVGASAVPRWGGRGFDPRSGDALVAVPRHWDAVAADDPDHASWLRAAVSAVIGDLVEAGRVAVSCRPVTGDTAVYRWAAGEGASRPDETTDDERGR